MSASIVTRNTSDVEINSIDFGNISPGGTSSTAVVRFYNSGDATPSAMAIGCICITLKYTGQTNGAGQEIVTEKMVQAKVGAGSWTPIGGDPTNAANVLSVTPPAAGAYIDVSFQLVVPAGADTDGPVAVFPLALYAVEV